MYMASYVEQIEATPKQCRDRERRAFDQAIALLERARDEGCASTRSAEALDFLCRLWQVLLEDLASPENDLPEVLRADLVSIGLWSVKQAESIRAGHGSNYSGLIQICTIVRDGLR